MKKTGLLTGTPATTSHEDVGESLRWLLIDLYFFLFFWEGVVILVCCTCLPSQTLIKRQSKHVVARNKVVDPQVRTPDFNDRVAMRPLTYPAREHVMWGESAREASWRRVFDPYAPLLFNLYHYLEQNLHFEVVPEHKFWLSRGRYKWTGSTPALFQDIRIWSQFLNWSFQRPAITGNSVPGINVCTSSRVNTLIRASNCIILLTFCL